jgi:hypothetical protein
MMDLFVNVQHGTAFPRGDLCFRIITGQESNTAGVLISLRKKIWKEGRGFTGR